MPTIGESTSITRNNLLKFPEETKRLILELQKKGWRIFIDKNTHARLLAPDGVTTLGASTNDRAIGKIKALVSKYYAEHPEPDVAPVRLQGASEKIQCPRPGCGRWFANFDFLDRHTHVDHEGLAICPECLKYYGKSERIVNMHRAREHGYESPTKAARKAAERRRKQEFVESIEVHDSNFDLFDEQEILSIEPHKLSYTAESLDLQPVPAPAPVSVPQDQQPLPGNDMSWDDVTLTIGVRASRLRNLINAYQAAGLEVRLQVRKTNG